MGYGEERIAMRLLDVIYPRKCVFCGELLKKSENGACVSCAGHLPYVREPVCGHCGKPIAGIREALCADCAGRERSELDQAVALWVYRDGTKEAMKDFKYGGCRRDALYYADELAVHCGRRILDWSPDVLVPIPIHRRRARFRGYNQAGLLAKELGDRLGLPVRELLKRCRYTTPLKKLTPSERAANLRSAFAVDDYDPDEYRRVILVDDIYTTGATLEACAGLLKRAGARAVHAVCLCIGSER